MQNIGALALCAGVALGYATLAYLGWRNHRDKWARYARWYDASLDQG